MDYVDDIRRRFVGKYLRGIRRAETIELQNVMFRADKPTIFGEQNLNYIKAELIWYETQDRKVRRLFDIYGKEVEIWNNIKDQYGCVMSQYGNLIYSTGQFDEVAQELSSFPMTRQAVMYYAPGERTQTMGRQGRPHGVTDHVCTTSVQYFINHSYIDCQVNMRSNDAVFGYINDLAWQEHVLMKLARRVTKLSGKVRLAGNVTWCAGSLHIYPRHYNLIQDWIDNEET